MLPYGILCASFLAPAACEQDPSPGCWSASAVWTVRLLGAVGVGLGAPLLWTGQGVYLARLAEHQVHARLQPALNHRLLSRLLPPGVVRRIHAPRGRY